MMASTTPPTDQEFEALDHLPKVREKLFEHRGMPKVARGVRLDIPSVMRGLPVVSIHEKPSGGTVIGYDHSAVIKDVRFIVQASGQRDIGALGANKRPMAYIAGVLVDEPAEPVGTPIYYDPRKVHLYVDATNMRPVKGAAKVNMIGKKVYAQGIVYFTAEDVPQPPEGMTSEVVMPSEEADVRAAFDFRELRKEPVSAAAKKYDHIDFTPPKGVRAAAKRGLEMRKEHGRGGTAIGVARARDLSNGKQISPSTAKRMKAYFDRHQPDQKAKGFDSGEEGYPSAGRVAWELWGGDAGYAWAKKLVKQMEAADKKVSGSSDVCISGSHFVYAGCSCSTDGRQGQPPADMTVSNLKTLLRDVNELLTSVDEEMELMGWAEDKVSQARLLIDSVKNYVKNDIADPQPQALEASKKPWEEKRSPEGKLSPKWRAEAEKRAKKAGRKYPNQIDNMWAAEQQNKTSEEYDS